MNQQKSKDVLGFTLIELMVVLVVVGATSAYVGPNLWKQYIKASERGAVQNVAIGLQELRHAAFVGGQVIAVNESDGHIKQLLTDGWKISAIQKIYFLPSGVTSGGSIHFVSPAGFQWQMKLTPLDGEVEITRL